MRVMNNKWIQFGVVIGLMVLFLTLQQLYVRWPVVRPLGSKGETLTNKMQGINSRFPKVKESSSVVTTKPKAIKESSSVVTMKPKAIKESSSVVTTKPKAIPSLDQDWGELKCPLTKLTEKNQNLHDYINEITLPCEMPVMVGGFFIGGRKNKKAFFAGEKHVCISKSFNFINGDCISLSFGISGDWSFDDQLDKVYGCKVYAFDPTIGRPDHNRSENIRFFNMGISDGPGWLVGGKLNSYSAILKILGMENTVIDYLKIDIEGGEWKFFKDVLTKTPNLLKNVKQIGMELHLPGRGLEPIWGYFQHLDCLGFRVMFIHFHPVLPKWKVNGKWRTDLYEIVWGQDRKW